jgi:surface protein
MAEVIFNLKGIQKKIKCSKDDLMKDIFQKFAKENSLDINRISFHYKGNKINQKAKFIELANEEDKKKLRLSINCIQPKSNRQSLKLDINQKDCNSGKIYKNKRESIKIEKMVMPPMNEIRKSIRKKVEINDPPKNENNFDNDFSIFSDYFRTFSCEIDLSKPEDQNMVNQLNYCPTLIENNDRNFTQAGTMTNIPNRPTLSNNISIRPNRKKIESIEKEMKELEIKFESINNKIKEVIDTLNQINENINRFYETTYDKMNNSEMVEKDEEIINDIKDTIYDYEQFINDINKSIEDNKISNISESFNKLMSTYIDSNKDIIKYKINEGDKKIRIFSQNFFYNNFDNCKIIHEDKEYPLSEYFNLENINLKNSKVLELKLKIDHDLKDLSFMFSDCTSLLSISKIITWNTDSIIGIKGMFAGCSSLASLPDLSCIKTNKIKSFRGVFAGCESLVSLPDISKWNTDNVTDMQYMFSNCYSLKTLPNLSKWNTSNVIDMRNMFCNCKSLIALPDISRWNVKRVQSMENMFEGCSSLFSLPNINKWDLGKKIEMRNMFNKCKKTLRIPIKFKKILNSYGKYQSA